MMTDLDVVRHIKKQTEGDAKFTGRTDAEYVAYLHGQNVGVSRAMAFLRKKKVLTPVVKDHIKHFRF